MNRKCVSCEKEYDESKMIPILIKGTDCYDEDDEEQLSGKFICKRCIKDSDDYGRCEFCSEDVAYHARDLKYSESGSSYCSEHISETYLDEDEENDREDYIENRTKDGLD